MIKCIVIEKREPFAGGYEVGVTGAFTGRRGADHHGSHDLHSFPGRPGGVGLAGKSYRGLGFGGVMNDGTTFKEMP